MKTIGNIILFIIIILVFSYIAFLTIFPSMIEKKIDSVAIKKNIFEVTKLNAEFTSPKAYTTNSLGIGLKFKEVKLTYADNKDFFYAPKVEIEVSALPLLIRTIKFNKISATAPKIDLIILPNREYKINDYFNEYFNTDNYPKLSKYTFYLSPITLINYNISTANLYTSRNETLTGKEQITPKPTVIGYLKLYLKTKENKQVKIK